MDWISLWKRFNYQAKVASQRFSISQCGDLFAWVCLREILTDFSFFGWTQLEKFGSY